MLIFFNTSWTSGVLQTRLGTQFGPVPNLSSYNWIPLTNTSVRTADINPGSSSFLQWVQDESHGGMVDLPFFFSPLLLAFNKLQLWVWYVTE
jgi:hypothetical protein